MSTPEYQSSKTMCRPVAMQYGIVFLHETQSRHVSAGTQEYRAALPRQPLCAGVCVTGRPLR